MCPPSLHESGERYEWIACQEPWSAEIAVMPQWLCEEIDTLAAQYGAGSSATSPKDKKTPPPNHSTTPFGQVIDGREDLMTRFIWGWIVNLRREAPMINDAFMATQCGEAFTVFERKVKSRLPHDVTKTNAELLEQEGRGITMFRQKWQYAAKQWEDKVADHARQDPPRGEAKGPFELDGICFDPETGEILGEVLGPANKDEFAAAPAAENKFKLIPSDELIDEPAKWLVKDLIPANSLSSLYGKPGTYKTFVALYAASHIALGWRVFDKETEQGDVVYIAGEGGAGLKRRHEALRKRHNMPPVKRLFFLKAQLNLRSKIDDVAGLIKEIKTNQIQPKLIVIDTLARAFAGGNENASEDMGAFIAMVGLLQQATGASVLLVHHSGKDQARGQRGHSSLLGAVESELELMKLLEDDSIHRIGQLTTTKQKDGEDGLKFLFHMETVSLSDIDPENASLALVPIDKITLRQKESRKKMSPSEINALEILKRVYAAGTKIVFNDNIPKNAEVMSLKLWFSNFYATGGYKDSNSARAAFNRIKNALKNKNIVSFWKEYCWFTEDYLSTKQM